jgi:hypothetical protein
VLWQAFGWEQNSNAIATHQQEFAEQLHKYEVELKTLHANAQNIERLLNNPLFAGQKTILHQLWVAPLHLGAAQIETDLSYLSATDKKAERTLQSLRTIAEVRSGRWERGMTLLLGLFVVFGVAEMFPEITEFCLWQRGVIVAGATVLISGITWGLSRRK